MNTPINHMESVLGAFSAEATAAAQRGTLNAAPLIDGLERAAAVCYGVRSLVRILRANELQRSLYADRTEGETIEPPLSDAAVDGLLALGGVAAELVERDIERLAEWADEEPAVPPRKRKAEVSP